MTTLSHTRFEGLATGFAVPAAEAARALDVDPAVGLSR